MTVLMLRGFEIRKQYLNKSAQMELVSALRSVAQVVPPFSPMTPFGRAMSVKMTSAGSHGWFTDASGHGYVRAHPNGQAWPEIPPSVLDIWNEVSGVTRKPECCLINFYGEGARMGLHQDRDEVDMSCSVVSISLGDEGLLRVGSTTRGGKTESLWLQSGDVVVMGGAARLAYHGVDRIKFGSSRLLPKGGRINVTLRVVT